MNLGFHFRKQSSASLVSCLCLEVLIIFEHSSSLTLQLDSAIGIIVYFGKAANFHQACTAVSIPPLETHIYKNEPISFHCVTAKPKLITIFHVLLSIPSFQNPQLLLLTPFSYFPQSQLLLYLQLASLQHQVSCANRTQYYHKLQMGR
jgi:hypothetical protein